jgi:hypothetical protein
MAADRYRFVRRLYDSYELDAIRAIQAMQLSQKETRQPRMDTNGFKKARTADEHGCTQIRPKFAAASLENLSASICVHPRLDLFFFYSRQFVSIRG